MTFFVPGIPRTKGSWRPVQNPRTGRTRLVPQIAHVISWQQSVALAAREAWGPSPPSAKAVSVLHDFKLLRPKSHLKADGTLRADAPKFPTGKRCGDLDKLIRADLDAMTGVVYEDDGQVCGSSEAKRYADGCAVGVTITVNELCVRPRRKRRSSTAASTLKLAEQGDGR